MKFFFILFFVSVSAFCQVPENAIKHKSALTRSALLIWGLDAPVSTFAAQIHQESLWRADARSRVGAQGMAQFMPATGEWIVIAYPNLGSFEPYNATWAIRALITYDLHLYKRVRAVDECERMAKVLSAYNGGLRWIGRDERLAIRKGYDPARWFDNVERVNSGRAQWAFVENRGYPRKILKQHEPLYSLSGFGRGVCNDL